MVNNLSIFYCMTVIRPLNESRLHSQSFHGYGAWVSKKGKRKVQEVSQSQIAALPRPQEEEETNKSKQARIEQTYEKH